MCRRPMETPPARHSSDRRPLSSGGGPQRAGTGVGGPVRTEVVWVSAGPWLRRRDRLALHHPEGRKQASVDRRRRLVGGVRHDRPLTTVGRARIVPARDLIAGWLRAGVVEDGMLTPTEEGTPQGGVISPLLMNV